MNEYDKHRPARDYASPQAEDPGPRVRTGFDGPMLRGPLSKVNEVEPRPPVGATLHADLRYLKGRAADLDDARAQVHRDVEHVMSYHGWSTEQQDASDAVNVHLKAAMEAVILNLPACGDRHEVIRRLSMVRMLVNRALTLDGAL